MHSQDQTALFVQSDLDLHCLKKSIAAQGKLQWFSNKTDKPQEIGKASPGRYRRTS